jgi:hypothetical protein
MEKSQAKEPSVKKIFGPVPAAKSEGKIFALLQG